MLKNENTNNSLFQIFKDELTDFVSVEQTILFTKLREKIDEFNEVFDESTIKVAEVEKELNLLNCTRYSSFENDFNFLEIHFNIVNVYNYFEKESFMHMKLRLSNIYLKFSLS